MPQPASDGIAAGVIEVMCNVSRRPIEPSLDSELVADLAFDSLQLLELVAELEDRFAIAMPPADLPAAKTVADVVDHVARLLNQGTPER